MGSWKYGQKSRNLTSMGSLLKIDMKMSNLFQNYTYVANFVDKKSKIRFLIKIYSTNYVWAFIKKTFQVDIRKKIFNLHLSLVVKYYVFMLYLAYEPMPVNGSQPTAAVKFTFLPTVMSRNENIL